MKEKTCTTIDVAIPADRNVVQKEVENNLQYKSLGIEIKRIWNLKCTIIPVISQMKHQLDATLCRFYFCRVTLHVSGASAHHQEYLKLVRRPLVHVLSLQVSNHISLLGPELNACARNM